MTIRAFRYFETTAPAVVTCWRCSKPTVYGLAEGVIARADITPISGAQEAAAIRAGLQTYTLRRTGLVQRDAYRRSDPALASPVLATHVCPNRRSP
jgi:hypothetical protein